MIDKNRIIDILTELYKNSDTDKVKSIYKKLLEQTEKLNAEQLKQLSSNILGENFSEESFKNWAIKRAEPDHDFIPINNYVSYHIQNTTMPLHIIPQEINSKELRQAGTFLVDALDKIIERVNNGEFKDIDTVFAVSDILRLTHLQKIFSDLGFTIRKGDEKFKAMFRNPYQASISMEHLTSKEWQTKRIQFLTKTKNEGVR